MIDNSDTIARFCPQQPDGDTFIYTEMLDRGKRKGNNGQRLVKTFYHRSVDEFREQMDTIRKLCDLARIRACTRLATRSFKKVGRAFTRLVVDTAMSENWAGMKSLYNRALGTVTPERKLWLFDVDAISEKTDALRTRLGVLGVLHAEIPSKKGVHYITSPFHVEADLKAFVDLFQQEIVSIHRDNPTNLYIPDEAE